MQITLDKIVCQIHERTFKQIHEMLCFLFTLYFKVNFQSDFRFYSFLFVSLGIYHSKFKLRVNIKKRDNLMQLHNTIVECIDEQIP